MAAMQNLAERNLIDCIRNATQPMLGICLGMQLMTEFSTEGNVAALGLMNGQTELIPNSGLPLPHMGWNKVRYTPDHPLFAGIEQDSHFYFVHSYAVQPNENTIATSHYGVDFSAAIANKNFYGVQFHPEVRHSIHGNDMLRNFVFDICGATGDWSMDSFIEMEIAKIREKVGNKKVLLGLSGGVDSSVVGVLLQKAIGDQLICIFVDHGLLA